MPRMARGRTVIAGGLLALSLGLAPAARAASAGDLITDNGFESSTAGFEASSALDGSVGLTADNPIAGAQSLHVALNPFGRASFTQQYGFGGGPLAESVSVAAKVRVDAGTAGNVLQVCAIAYAFLEQDPHEVCRGVPVGADHVVDASATVPMNGLRVDRVIFQLRLNTGGTIEATVDDAHAFVNSEKLPPVPDGYSLADYITDHGFETSKEGFAPFYRVDGRVSRSSDSPISGAWSLRVNLNDYGRAGKLASWGYDGGPLADSVTVAGKVRVDRGPLAQVCSIAYFFLDPEPATKCETVRHSADVFVSLPTNGRKLSRVFFQVSTPDDPVNATLDDAHLYVVERPDR
jgi:hypothetical protein